MVIIFFNIRSPKQNPEKSRDIFFKKIIHYSDFKTGGAITKSEIFKKHQYWGKMTTRGNLVTLILIITLGCSHAYVGRIIKAKILLGIMINTFFQNLPLSQVVIYHRKRGGTVFSFGGLTGSPSGQVTMDLANIELTMCLHDIS